MSLLSKLVKKRPCDCRRVLKRIGWGKVSWVPAFEDVDASSLVEKQTISIDSMQNHNCFPKGKSSVLQIKNVA
eukprot:2530677-Amphidinium_carterae.1